MPRAATTSPTVYDDQARYADAEAFYKRALGIREMKLGPEDAMVAASLNNLATLYLYALARYADAEPLLKRALAIREKIEGPQGPKFATSLVNLASLHQARGQFAEAEPLYKRALAIREAALGPEHPLVAISLTKLAVFNRVMGRYGEAEPLLLRVLANYEKTPGHDQSIALTNSSLADLRSAQGRFGDAKDLYERALAISEKTLSPDHPAVGLALNNLAMLYRVQGRYGEAETMLKRALAITEKVLGGDHPEVGTRLNNLASVLASQGRYADAEPLQQRALAITEKALGPDHPDAGTTLSGMAELYRAQGRYAEADPVNRRALAIAEKALGPDHPDVGIRVSNLAELYRAQDRLAEAEPLYRRALAIGEKALGAEHPTVALIKGNLGAFLKSEGRIEEAAPLLTQALEASEKALGSEHPQVVRGTIQLAELYGLQGRMVDAGRLFARAGAAGSVDMKKFPVYFGTNRKRDQNGKRIAFSNQRNLGELALGSITVIVPPASADANTGSRTAGNAARISDVRQLSIQPTELLAADALVRTARGRLLGARNYIGQVLVFVHGYNVSFDNAVRRAGQLAYDLDFDGPVFVFSWPSREGLLSYMTDRESSQLSGESLREFLETVVGATNASRIHIIAHSMGNIVLNEAMHSMDGDALKKLNLGEMVLASPDLDPDLFIRNYRRLQSRGAISTIYAATSDRALSFSSWLRDGPQLGYIPSGGPTRLVPGADMIDITSVNSDVFNLNHDLYANSPAIIGDLKRLLKEGTHPPEVRTDGMEKVPAPVAGGTYWRYRQLGAKP